MKKIKFPLSLLITSSLVLITGYSFSGCAPFHTWGTYQKKSITELDLHGKSDIYGTIRITPYLFDVAKGHSDNSAGYVDVIRIEPGNIKTQSDISGNFVFKGLDPGRYSVYFTNGYGNTKRADLTLRPDQQVDITIFIQSLNDKDISEEYPGNLYYKTFEKNSRW